MLPRATRPPPTAALVATSCPSPGDAAQAVSAPPRTSRCTTRSPAITLRTTSTGLGRTPGSGTGTTSPADSGWMPTPGPSPSSCSTQTVRGFDGGSGEAVLEHARVCCPGSTVFEAVLRPGGDRHNVCRLRLSVSHHCALPCPPRRLHHQPHQYTAQRRHPQAPAGHPSPETPQGAAQVFTPHPGIFNHGWPLAAAAAVPRLLGSASGLHRLLRQLSTYPWPRPAACVLSRVPRLAHPAPSSVPAPPAGALPHRDVHLRQPKDSRDCAAIAGGGGRWVAQAWAAVQYTVH